MSKSDIISIYDKSPKIAVLESTFAARQKSQMTGLVGSSLSFVANSLFKKSELPFLILFSNKEEAAYYLNDLEQLINTEDVLFYPSSYRRPYQIEETDNANVLLRAEVLNRINSRKKPAIIVSYAEAIFEKVVTRKELEKNTLKLSVGDNLSIDFINETLFEYNFKRVDFVTEPGEFSVRGGIIDVFSFSNDNPYRIEFFGNEVDSIRSFDVETQLSVEKLKKISIIPNVENKLLQENRESFLDYINEKTVLVIQNTELLGQQLDKLFDKANEAFEKLSKDIQHAKPEELFLNQKQFLKRALDFSVIELHNQAVFKIDKKVEFHIQPQPSFNKQFDLLLNNLSENHFNGYKNYLCCSNENQASRFHDIFEDIDEANHESIRKQYKTMVLPLFEGFIDEENQIACYTDHQIFERYHKFSIKNGYSKKQTITLKELTSLSVGDYVTHIDHGIGKFGGLQKIQVEGKTQEAIKLVYADNDIVYVSIHSLHKISKYNGKDGAPPKIYKLGSNAWKTLKQKTKARVKHIAFNLIQLYAKRRLDKGFQFAPDSYLQKELESSFIYEDTPDQITATADLKADMENERPMDRLVCGDVGFGKTEVAIRAAFKAVDNSKQVAVLVPTTILAMQHYKTFNERLSDFPVRIDYINRFKTSKQVKDTLDALKAGKVDIIIGTHKLVSKDVKFKDLGLLIIDEEQKFGVTVKEKLKQFRANVDTLTLTATPIPRTLHFSLMGARDLSIIQTPPPNRQAVQTELHVFNETLIKEAVEFELDRDGQVFFIHNRVADLRQLGGLIQKLVPKAKIAIAHGQLEGDKLEDIMLDFIDGKYDVLVATTIIEAGLDVPNANTMLINHAHMFGLSDLHQMRGRVGRSNKKAFCYLLSPPLSTLTSEARKRLSAIEEFSDLGSGFNVAMRDLDIRGSGNLLGAEQSGFIAEIGFDMYHKILDEAIQELKEDEFKGLFNDEKPRPFVNFTQIDTDMELMIPDEYVTNIQERYNLYTELSKIENQTQLDAFAKELHDRFGPVPRQVRDLLRTVELQWIGKEIGLEKISWKKGVLRGYFISDKQSKYFETDAFGRILAFAQQNPRNVNLKEVKNTLRIAIEGIRTIDDAIFALEQMRDPVMI